MVRGLAAGGPGLVVVGRHDEDPPTVPRGVVWVSADGVSWTRLDDPAVFAGPDGKDVLAVAADERTVVAVGVDCSGADWNTADCDAAVWESADGNTWARVPHDEATFGGPKDQWMLSVTAGGPGFVAVGSDLPGGRETAAGAVWVSPDGQTWSRVPHDEAVFGIAGTGTRIMDVTAGGPGLVAVGYEEAGGYQSAVVWVSADGNTWTRVDDAATFGGTGGQGMNAVAAFGSGLVAAGWDTSAADPEAQVWASADGYHWVRVAFDAGAPGAAGQLRIRDLVAFGSGLVAVGNDASETGADGGLPDLDAAVWLGAAGSAG
jgi:hypothetical protein